MIQIALGEEPNSSLLRLQIQSQFPDSTISWGQEGILFVYRVDESDRVAIEAIVAAHDNTQMLTWQQTQKTEAEDKTALFAAFADSPVVYDLLVNERPATMTNDDIVALADIARYMWEQLGIEMPEWTQNARSG